MMGFWGLILSCDPIFGLIRSSLQGSKSGWAMAPLDFGKSVNPISTKEADYAHEIILAPSDFQTFLRPWFALFKIKRAQKSECVGVQMYQKAYGVRIQFIRGLSIPRWKFEN